MNTGKTRGKTTSDHSSPKCPSCRTQHVDVILTFRDKETIEIARCRDCPRMIVIIDGVTVYAGGPVADEPCEKLPSDVREAYREACKVVSVSPRAACLILEPHVKGLCEAAGARGENLADKIRWMCDKGHLPAEVAGRLAASGDQSSSSEEETRHAEDDAYDLMRITNYLGNARMPQYGKY